MLVDVHVLVPDCVALTSGVNEPPEAGIMPSYAKLTEGLFQLSEELLACCVAVAVFVLVLLPAPVAVTVMVGDDSALPFVVPLVVALTSPVDVLLSVNLPLSVMAYA